MQNGTSDESGVERPSTRWSDAQGGNDERGEIEFGRTDAMNGGGRAGGGKAVGIDVLREEEEEEWVGGEGKKG
jgi:hypothetical protein